MDRHEMEAKMAGQMNTLEVKNDVIDLTTDDCVEVIPPKNRVIPSDCNVNASVVSLSDTDNTEDDVEFIGRCARFVPVITISETGTLESDECNNEDIKCLKSSRAYASHCSRSVSNPGILNNKCALSDTISCALKASSVITLEHLSEQSEGCGKWKRKSCSNDVESQQIKTKRTADKAHAFERHAAACYQQNHHSVKSEYNIQAQNREKEVLPEGKCPQNEICKWKVKNENDSKAHVKKQKIKVRVVRKKCGSWINRTQQNTQVKENVSIKNTRSHKAFFSISDGVKKEDLQNVSYKNVNEDNQTQSQTPGSENVVNKEHLNMKSNYFSTKISDQVSTFKREPINKVITKKETYDIISDVVKRIRTIIESDSSKHAKANGECEAIKKISEVPKETSSDHTEQSSTVCSQLALSTAKFTSHVTGDVREGLSCNEVIQALPSSSTAHEQREESMPEVQLLPVKMTITECENQVVYAVPLLRLPIQKQIIYFSPEYIEVFLKKVRDVFSVEKFLHAIPDPFQYFRKKNSERRYNDECLALMYLKSKYRKIPFPDIDFIFEKNRYSLTLTCDELAMWRSSWRSRTRKIGLGCGCLKPHELSMPFVHEVTFIENMRVIENHLQSKKRKKATAFEIAKLRGELKQCGHCGVCDLLFEDMAPCSVFHLFCKICIQNVVDTRLRECENPFSCLLKECQWIFSMEVLKNAVKPITFSCLLHIRHLKEMEVCGVKLLETCPYCGFADIPSKDDEVFCCLNPDCMRETCRQCKGPNHMPYPCVMAVRPQKELPRIVTNRSYQYNNQFQSTEMHQRNDIVQQQGSFMLQHPCSVMQYQQPAAMQHPEQEFNHCPHLPSMQHYQQPPVQHYQQLPMQHYQQPSMQHYQQPPMQHYQQPPMQHYQQPSMQHYQQPPVQHYQQPLMQHPQSPSVLPLM